jgi:hypothetical protein
LFTWPTHVINYISYCNEFGVKQPSEYFSLWASISLANGNNL